MHDRRSTAPPSWQTSDLIDAETGLVGKKLDGTAIVPSEIRLTADQRFIEWRIGNKPKQKRFQSQAFDKFLDLATGAPRDVLIYARKFGTLHPIRADSGREPVDEWVSLSKRAGAVLSLVTALKTGTYGERETWAIIGMLDERGRAEAKRAEEIMRYGLPVYTVKDPIEMRQRGYSKARILAAFGETIATELNAWIGLAGVGIESRFLGFTSAMPWEAAVTWKNRLFGALTLQLVYAVSGALLRFKCAKCGKLYSRKRKPTYGRFDFCPKCGRRAAVRMAESRRRAKMAEARELAATGLGADTIGKRLDTEPATVRRWLKRKRER